MQKTIKIENKDVKFSFNLASFYIFKNQFGYDGMSRILPVVGEVLNALNPKLITENGKVANEKYYELILKSLGDIFEEQTFLEITDILNLIWAFAKCGDKTIPEPELWYREFDEFPLYDVIKELFPVFYESLISKKKKLTTTKKQTKK